VRKAHTSLFSVCVALHTSFGLTRLGEHGQVIDTDVMTDINCNCKQPAEQPRQLQCRLSLQPAAGSASNTAYDKIHPHSPYAKMSGVFANVLGSATPAARNCEQQLLCVATMGQSFIWTYPYSRPQFDQNA
jgi:hypothetical protein